MILISQRDFTVASYISDRGFFLSSPCQIQVLPHNAALTSITRGMLKGFSTEIFANFK